MLRGLLMQAGRLVYQATLHPDGAARLVAPGSGGGEDEDEDFNFTGEPLVKSKIRNEAATTPR